MDVAGLVVVVVVGMGVVLVASVRVSVDARRIADRLLLLRFHRLGVDAGADEHETIIGQTCPLLLKPHLLTSAALTGVRARCGEGLGRRVASSGA